MPTVKPSTSETATRTLEVRRLGREAYGLTWALQKRLLDQRIAEQIPDTLLLVEHNPVYTLGRNADPDHVLADAAWLERHGVEVFHIERGGDVTYHGPGQVVGYPILALRQHGHDVHKYLRDLEEVIIRTLADYDVTGGRDPDNTGVWVGNEKIAAMGVKLSRWVTMHGFAFNVNTDLQYYAGIIPCGIQHKGVTSLAKLLGREVLLQEVEDKLVYHFTNVFRLELV